MGESALADISHTIQLAVAPVFLLTAIGTTLNVLTNRLARVIDRARQLEGRFPEATSQEQERSRGELDELSRRARYIHTALTTGVASALCVCLLITLAFLGYLFGTNLGPVVAVLFIVALVLLVFSLVSFLREVFLSVKSLRFGIRTIAPPPAP